MRRQSGPTHRQAGAGIVAGNTRRAAGAGPEKLAHTFNCDIGMVALAHPEEARPLAQLPERRGETVDSIDRIVRGTGAAMRPRNAEARWRG